MRAAAVTITDNFWIRQSGSNESYEDVRFKENLFADVVLEGKLDAFSDGRWQHPSSSPELTNVGSFEKCWRFENDTWWMYKRGDGSEQFAELFTAAVIECLGYAGTKYYLTSTGVKSKDFTENGNIILTQQSGLLAIIMTIMCIAMKNCRRLAKCLQMIM